VYISPPTDTEHSLPMYTGMRNLQIQPNCTMYTFCATLQFVWRNFGGDTSTAQAQCVLALGNPPLNRKCISESRI
jgi:hypothetical protein